MLFFPAFLERKILWSKIKNGGGQFFSSTVPPGSGAFQMPTCPSSSASASASASTLRGGRANLRNASVTFSLFLHEASLG